MNKKENANWHQKEALKVMVRALIQYKRNNDIAIEDIEGSVKYTKICGTSTTITLNRERIFDELSAIDSEEEYLEENRTIEGVENNE